MTKKQHAFFNSKTNLLLAFWALFLIFSCSEKHGNEQSVKQFSEQPSDEYFVEKILSLDTLRNQDDVAAVKTEVEKLKNVDGIAENPYYQYFLSFLDWKNDRKDQSVKKLKNMQTDGHAEAEFLKKLSLLENDIKSGAISSAKMEEVTRKLHNAEKNKSKFTYKYYDLLARCYYQNQMVDQSELYMEKYFANSPFKNHPKIRQRYFDISFLLAAKKGDFEKMKAANAEARKLALQINDTLSYERTLDSETQIYAMMGENKKALEKSRTYVKAFEKRKIFREVPYNNLGKTYLLNLKPDSALIYFKKANELMYKNPKESHVFGYWDGIRDSYEMMGDYKNALIALDSSRAVERRMLQIADSKKIAEIHEKYQSDKKDSDIQALQLANLKNEKTITQQRWILFSVGLLTFSAAGFFYSRYRNRLLKDKNALLREENKRLITEQKMLQVQLNPHFVFNAIANLQGLISTGEKSLATKYLSGFSKLLRDTLEQSRKDFISVDEEMETLGNYLSLQQMRFSDVFEYEISADENLDVEQTLIPPMLIQPFVENSIEHGFRNIDYKGLIKIHFSANENQLKIKITDNGKGFTENTGIQNNKKSLSRVILKERLEALFSKNENPAHFEIIDKSASNEPGVEVNIELPKILD